MLFPLLRGFTIGISLIVVIGPQNLFIIRQASTHSHTLIAALIFALCDALLVVIGAMGLGSLIAIHPLLQKTMIIAGILFLLSYAALALVRAIKGGQTQDGSQAVPLVRTTIFRALALALLNPHAYLDTAVLIGGVAAQYDQLSQRGLFAIGACLASTLWFFSLALFARTLGPFLKRPTTARLLDGLSAVIMAAIALFLILKID